MLTKEQRELRRYRVGASEIGALLDFYTPNPDGTRIDPHKTILDVFNDKILPPQEAGDVEDHRSWGSDVEQGILANHARKAALVLEPPCGTLISARYPMLCATPDGIGRTTLHSRRVIEAKNAQWHQAHRWGEPGTDIAPLQYVGQVVTTIGIAAENGDVEDTADLAAAIAGSPPKVYVIPFRQSLFETFAELAAKFVRDHLIPEKPPLIDGSKASEEYIKRLYPRETPGKLIDPTEEILVQAELVKMLRKTINATQVDLEEAENKLKAAIGDAEGVLGVCTWKKQKDSIVALTNWQAIAGILAERFNLDPQEATELVRAHTKPVKTRNGARPLVFPKEK